MSYNYIISYQSTTNTLSIHKIRRGDILPIPNYISVNLKDNINIIKLTYKPSFLIRGLYESSYFNSTPEVLTFIKTQLRSSDIDYYNIQTAILHII